MMEKPKPNDEAIEPVVNDSPELFQLIDWMFFAGAPLPEPEVENEEGVDDEPDIRDDGLGS